MWHTQMAPFVTDFRVEIFLHTASAEARQQCEGTHTMIFEFSSWENELLLRGQWVGPTDTAGSNLQRLLHGYVGWIYRSTRRNR